ncbi:MAG: CotH kinase family protein [Lachnospiraceae bacterium]|nr:CotH kinase family protein [Lachnospiraceae bacterium]
MNRKYIVAAAITFVLAAALTGFLRWVVREPAVRFSEEEAFQEEAFELTLRCGLSGGTIRYTLDGSDPTMQSRIYEGPIPIEAGLPEKVTVVKAAVFQNGEPGKICTQTYFVGEGVSELFDVMVVSLSADEKALYDEETGILANYEEEGENGEWDRPAYVEFYEPDGTRMLAQGTGIAVSGHGSREFAQKSFKLISDSVYDPEHPTFEYDFFETDMAGNEEGQSYNRLVLRNGGSDHEGTMLKWNVVSRLGKDSGMVCAGARPGILFLNGTYYGIIQLQEKYTRYNIAHAIGAQKDDIEKYEPNEINSARFGGYYNQLRQDLNDPERMESLERQVDMTDMLKHYAVNLIMNNVDWPYHNFLSWKCAETSSSAYGDGKVRFFLYDLDAVYQDTTGYEVPDEFAYLMEEPIEDATDTLYLLMQSELYRTRFVNMVCDLTATVYQEDHVLRLIEEENEKLAGSMELYYTEEERMRQQAAVDRMKEAAEESCIRVHEGLQEHLKAADPYTLRLELPDGIQVSFSEIRLKGGESYTGTYYHNYPLTLTAEPENGQEFYGWLVNGEEIRTAQLLLDEGCTADEMHIQLITEP